MKCVLDASAALCWVLPRPNSGKALQLRADFQNAVHELIAPSIFSGEVASALTKAERQKFIAVGDARPLLGRVMRTPPVMHPSTVARPGSAYLLADSQRAVRLPLYGSCGARGVRTGDGRPKAHCQPAAAFPVYCAAGVAAIIRPGPGLRFS